MGHERLVAELGLAYHAVISRAQLRAEGLSDPAIALARAQWTAAAHVRGRVPSAGFAADVEELLDRSVPRGW